MKTIAHFNVAIVAAVLATIAISHAEEKDEEKDVVKRGYGLGPGMVVAGNIPLGKSVSPGIEFEAHNYGKVKRTLILKAFPPVEAGLVSWEKGYEAIPDSGWCKLDRELIEAEPESVTKVKISFNIPNDKKWLNRKFLVGVTLEQSPDKNTAGAGFNLRMVSRVGIETTSSEETDGANASSICLIPSILRKNSAKAGESYTATVKIRNNRQETVKLTPKLLREVESEKEKYDRYFGAGRKAIVEESWIIRPDAFVLQTGETKIMQVVVHVPPGATREKIFEELLFLEDEKKRLEFVRVRTAIAD